MQTFFLICTAAAFILLIIVSLWKWLEMANDTDFQNLMHSRAYDRLFQQCRAFGFLDEGNQLLEPKTKWTHPVSYTLLGELYPFLLSAQRDREADRIQRKVRDAAYRVSREYADESTFIHGAFCRLSKKQQKEFLEGACHSSLRDSLRVIYASAI